MKRLGDLHKRFGGRSYFLADKIIGEERSITQVARWIGQNERYINGRFREALDDIAHHYGLRLSKAA